MALPESAKEQLSRKPLILTCPGCHRDTPTGYTKWDETVLSENPGSFLEFTCTNCGAAVSYDPSTKELTKG